MVDSKLTRVLGFANETELNSLCFVHLLCMGYIMGLFYGYQHVSISP